MRDGNGYQCTMSQIRGPGGGNFQNKKNTSYAILCFIISWKQILSQVEKNILNSRFQDFKMLYRSESNFLTLEPIIPLNLPKFALRKSMIMSKSMKKGFLVKSTPVGA